VAVRIAITALLPGVFVADFSCLSGCEFSSHGSQTCWNPSGGAEKFVWRLPVASLTDEAEVTEPKAASWKYGIKGRAFIVKPAHKRSTFVSPHIQSGSHCCACRRRPRPPNQRLVAPGRLVVLFGGPGPPTSSDRQASSFVPAPPYSSPCRAICLRASIPLPISRYQGRTVAPSAPPSRDVQQPPASKKRGHHPWLPSTRIERVTSS